jgi:hypothetical protein
LQFGETLGDAFYECDTVHKLLEKLSQPCSLIR